MWRMDVEAQVRWRDLKTVGGKKHPAYSNTQEG